MLSVVLVLLGVAGGIGWLVGRGFSGSVPPSAVDETAAPLITATVELRQLADTAIVPASLRVRDAQAVVYEGDLARPILTSIHVSAGDPIVDGTVLYEVSGQPVVAFVGTVVEYRDLARGAKGADVLELQTALGRLGYFALEPDGSFGTATAVALRRLLSDLGYDAEGLPFGHYLFIPDGARIVDVGAAEGARLGPDDVVLSYATGELEAVAEFTTGQTSLWTAESKAFLEGDSRPLRLDEVIPEDNGTISSFVFFIPFNVSNPPGSAVRLVAEFASTDGEVLAVPITALNVGPDGEVFVRRLENGRPSAPIHVEPGMEVDGWVEIEVKDTALSPSDTVILGAISEP